MTVIEEPPELVAMRLTLGKQLAARREAARIIQPQIARRTGYSRSSVAHAEAGRQLLTREFWKTADELVKAEGVLLARTGGGRESGRRCRCGTGQWPGRAAAVPGVVEYTSTGRAYRVERAA